MKQRFINRIHKFTERPFDWLGGALAVIYGSTAIRKADQLLHLRTLEKNVAKAKKELGLARADLAIKKAALDSFGDPTVEVQLNKNTTKVQEYQIARAIPQNPHGGQKIVFKAAPKATLN